MREKLYNCQRSESNSIHTQKDRLRPGVREANTEIQINGHFSLFKRSDDIGCVFIDYMGFFIGQKLLQGDWIVWLAILRTADAHLSIERRPRKGARA